MTVDARIAAFMPVAGSTAAAIVFLTTYRTSELRALLADESARTSSYVREAVICTLLPVLTALLIVFGFDLALDSLRSLTGKAGFDAPEAGFVLFVGLLVVVVIYQIFLAVGAWRELGKRSTNA
jgi:hypothetical protein